MDAQFSEIPLLHRAYSYELLLHTTLDIMTILRKKEIGKRGGGGGGVFTWVHLMFFNEY